MGDSEIPNKQEKKIQFWQDLWHDSIKNFLKRSFGLELLTPHVLIDNIILEIEDDSLQNQKNKQFFYRTINQFLDKDEIIRSHFKNDFILLRRIFNSERNGYILSICQSIQSKFRNGKYFDGSLEKISSLLLSSSPIDGTFLHDLNYYSQSIIVELLLKSYTLGEIKKFPGYILSQVESLDDGRFYTHFPHKTDINEYKDSKGQILWKSFGKNLTLELESLDLAKRIKALENYYYEKKGEAYYIFVIEGLRGNQVIKIGDVIFYSPNKKRFITEGEDYVKEYEVLQPHETKEKYMQAAAKVKFLTYESSLSEAVNKIENCIDLVYSFFGIKTKIKVLQEEYIVVKNSKYYGSSFHTSREDKVMKFHDSLDIDFNTNIFSGLKKYSKILDMDTKATKKIRNTLHWIRKGDSAKNDDDKLVFYWIALENLFTNKPEIKKDILGDRNASKFDLIKAILGANQLTKYVYEYGWDLFHYYRNVEDQFFGQSKFPETLLKKANLKTTDKKMYLKKFIKYLPELRKHEQNPYLIGKIDSLISFYKGSKNTLKTLEKKKISLEDDITMIYRFRNLIVHSATFDKTLLPYYAWKIRIYSKNLIRQIIWNFGEDQEIDQLLTKIFLKKDKYFERLKNEMIVFPEDLK
ncbi:hypothetical protein GGR42_001543 [Saonia flava]|uniref:Apea-like HEPN domain-containing protein n=1 Tax=Saonia flava TaxID=523696 RepID=A0A846QSF0_9FLAO|nr:hypothetical protein [Saonia flava]NJB71081.1 hypothetical protein [Saonia flava]